MYQLLKGCPVNITIFVFKLKKNWKY